MRLPLPARRLTLWGLLGVFAWLTLVLALFHHHDLPKAIAARPALVHVGSRLTTVPANIAAPSAADDHDLCQLCLFESNAFPLSPPPPLLPDLGPVRDWAVQMAVSPLVAEHRALRARAPPPLPEILLTA